MRGCSFFFGVVYWLFLFVASSCDLVLSDLAVRDRVGKLRGNICKSRLQWPPPRGVREALPAHKITKSSKRELCIAKTCIMFHRKTNLVSRTHKHCLTKTRFVVLPKHEPVFRNTQFVIRRNTSSVAQRHQIGFTETQVGVTKTRKRVRRFMNRYCRNMALVFGFTETQKLSH